MRKIALAVAVLFCTPVLADDNKAADVAPVLYQQRNAILDQLTSAQVEINRLRAELEKAKAENKCADGERK